MASAVDDPLTRFGVQTAEAFGRLRQEIDEAVVGALERLVVRDGVIDLDRAGIKGPSSTWTYLINDDPFRRQLGRMLTGQGNSTLAIGGAALAAPFFFLWLLADRFLRRRRRNLARDQ